MRAPTGKVKAPPEGQTTPPCDECQHFDVKYEACAACRWVLTRIRPEDRAKGACQDFKARTAA